MIIGFTGTRRGLTDDQAIALTSWLKRLPEGTEFHHGCCVGADACFVAILCDELPERGDVHAHPCDLVNMTERNSLELSDVSHDPLPPLDRNRVIVNAAGVLLSCPDGPERQRSGTWMTVRYARQRRKPIVIFWPDGSVTEETPSA